MQKAPLPWDNYRWRVAMFFIALVAMIPIALLAFSLTFFSLPQWLSVVMLVCGLGFFGVAGFRMNNFPCPRCGEPFFHRALTQNPLAQRCMHCRWPKWAVNDPWPTRKND